MLSILIYTCLSFASFTLVSSQYVPNSQALIIKELEHLYFDAASNGILSAVTPCTNFYDPNTGAASNSLGRQTAAEWIRTVFRRFEFQTYAFIYSSFHLFHGFIIALTSSVPPSSGLTVFSLSHSGLDP